jgi:hypothetical protein
MNQHLLPARAGDPDPWDQVLMAFLAEKLRRSGSMRTVQGYGRLLFPLFGRLGKTPDQVTSDRSARRRPATNAVVAVARKRAPDAIEAANMFGV